jgi:phage tail-like protein
VSISDQSPPENPPDDAGRITVYFEGNVVHEFRLIAAVLTIGRSPENGLPLPDPKVSRQHAELRLTPEGPILTDLGSANGTTVEGTQILAHQPYRLAGGTTFQIGSYTFIYESAALAERADAIVSPADAASPAQTLIQPAAEIDAHMADGESAPNSASTPDDPPSHPVPVAAVTSTTPSEPSEEAPVATPRTRSRHAAPEPAAEPAQPMAVVQASMRDAAALVALPPPAPPPPPRQTWDAPLPPGPWSSYLRNLPIIFQDEDFLARYLMIMESIWEPLEWRQNHLHMYVDPKTCPPGFLPWLASWLDPELDTKWPEERLRDLIARAMDLFRWRGTRYGLARMIELCTGFAPRISDDPSQAFCFRIQLEVPPSRGVDRRLLENLIQAQKPAHAGYVLELVVQPEGEAVPL